MWIDDQPSLRSSLMAALMLLVVLVAFVLLRA
jgi:hypothetical protein